MVYYIALYIFLPASSGLLYSSLALYGPSKHFDGYCACIMLAISKGYSCVREIQLTKEAAALKYVVMEWVITVILVFSFVERSKFSRVFFISLNCFMITLKPLFKSFLNLDLFGVTRPIPSLYIQEMHRVSNHRRRELCGPQKLTKESNSTIALKTLRKIYKRILCCANSLQCS